MKNLKGTFTALVTPFKNNKVDYASLDRLLAQQLDGGIDGFVVNGTTAESPTLESVEVREIFNHVRQFVGRDKVLIVGTGSNSTNHTIENSQKAEELGADTILVVVPYYNKPPQRGLFQHFKNVAASVKIPTLLYNVPGRTITGLSIDTVADLAKESGIVGIKEASGDILFAQEIIAKCGSEFVMLSGDDGTYVEFLASGGHGVISVASHVIPAQMVQWRKWVQSGDLAKARADMEKYSNLIHLLFCEANPIPVKMALHLMGLLDQAEMRLPLVELSSEHTQKLKAEMMKVGIL